MKTTTLTTVALGLAFIGAVLLPKDCKAQEGPWAKYQRAPIVSADSRTEYVPIPASIKDSGTHLSMLWSIHERTESHRLRFAITGCKTGSGMVFIVNAGDVPSPERPIEWHKDGATILDGIAQRTCAVAGV